MALETVLHNLSFILPAAVCCFLFQRMCKRRMEPTQYNYLRDLVLIAVWIVSAMWIGSPLSRFIVGTAVVASVLGMLQRLYPDKGWKGSYVLLGLLFAFFGPQISFVGLANGEYHYFSPWGSLVVTALWVAVFPVLLQELDKIPGMAGHLLAVCFSLLLIATAFAGQPLDDAFFMSLCGLAYLTAFWSRHGHMYRRLGEPLAALWGVLIAGTSVLGVSKGITFSTLILLPLGLFAIPMMETSLRAVSRIFPARSPGTSVLYRMLTGRGLDHPSTVRFIVSLCALAGAAVAMSQLGNSLLMMVWVSAAILFAGFSLGPSVRNMKRNAEGHVRPSIWSTSVDNVSMDYALSRTRGAVASGTGLSLVSTVNALAVMEAERNRAYAHALRNSFLTLADGTGVVWALRFLGRPVQERVTGIDFMERLCRMAAAEGWPVYFLGASRASVGGTVEALEREFPGLTVAGFRDGYFDPEDPSVCENVRSSGAKILFVALGVPKQEIWLTQHGEDLGNVVAVGVGGAFDVLSGGLRRAPVVWQKLGLEWLYRLIQEPWRWKRDLELFLFVVRVLLTKVGLYPEGGRGKGK